MLPSNFETMLHLNFKIIRLIDNRLEASFCDLDLDISINNKDDKNNTATRLKAIKMWIESFVDGCICYDAQTDIDTAMLAEISNHIMMCHSEPHDHVILPLLHTKMSTIGGDDILILRSTLSSDTGEGFSCRVSGPIGECLPTMQEWIGDKTYHSSPWWFREDSSMIDLQPDEDDDLTNVPILGENMILLINQESNLINRTTPPSEDDKPAEIIKPIFKPRIIENDDE